MGVQGITVCMVRRIYIHPGDRGSISRVLLPVSVICLSVTSILGDLCSYGCDPDRCKAHSLNIVQLMDVNLPNKR